MTSDNGGKAAVGEGAGAVGTQTFVVNALFGHVECRSWLEAEMMPNGDLRLVGMGSRTDYDEAGRVTAHKCEPTGVVAIWPAPEPLHRGWLTRLIGA